MNIGCRVVNKEGHSGTIRFIGATEFAPGEWVGVELDSQNGKNNGSINGKVYFTCNHAFGVFVRSTQLTIVASNSTVKKRPSIAASSSQMSPASSPKSSPIIDKKTLLKDKRLSTKEIIPKTPLINRSIHQSSKTPSTTERMSRSARPPTTSQNRTSRNSSVEPTSRTSRSSSVEPPKSRSSMTGSVDTSSRTSSRKSISTSNIIEDQNSKIKVLKTLPIEEPNVQSKPVDYLLVDLVSSVVEEDKDIGLQQVSLVDVSTIIDSTVIDSSIDNSSSNLDVKNRNISDFYELSNEISNNNDITVQNVVIPAAIDGILLRNIDEKVLIKNDFTDDTNETISNKNNFPDDTKETKDEKIKNLELKIKEIIKSNDHQTLIATRTNEKQIAALTKTNAETLHLLQKESESKIQSLQTKLNLLQSSHQLDETLQSQILQFTLKLDQSEQIRKAQVNQLANLRAQLSSGNILAGESDEFKKKVEEMGDMLEMTCLDLAVVEEKNRGLEEEVEVLRQRCEELEVDLGTANEKNGFNYLFICLNMVDLTEFYETSANIYDVLRTEGEVDESEEEETVELTVDHGGNGKIKALEYQNRRMREALMRLRDLTNEQEKDLLLKIASLQQSTLPSLQISEQNKLLKAKTETLESQLNALKSELDDTLNSLDLVESLTTKNIDLAEQKIELEGLVGDLEGLVKVGQEIEDVHGDYTRQIEVELDFKDGLVEELKERITDMASKLLDREHTIVQFRELVSTLKSDINKYEQPVSQTELDRLTKLADPIHRLKLRFLSYLTPDSTATTSTDNNQQILLSLSMQLKTTIDKFEKAEIECDVKSRECLLLTEKIEMLNWYLPDSVVSGECNEAGRCYLTFKAAVSDIEILEGFVEKKRVDAEEFDFRRRADDSIVLQKLTMLKWFSKRFIKYFETCTTIDFINLSKLRFECDGFKKKVKSILDLVKTGGQTNTLEFVDELTRIVQLLERMCLVHLPDPLQSSIGGLDPAGLLQMNVLARVFGYSIPGSLAVVESEGFGIEKFLSGELEGREGKWDGVLVCLKELLSGILGKLTKKLSSFETNDSKSISNEIVSKLNNLYSSSQLAVSKETQKLDFSKIDPNKFSKTVKEISQQTLGTPESHIGEALLKVFKALDDGVEEVLVLLEDENNSHNPVESVEKPWMVLGNKLKNDYQVNVDLQTRADALGQEVLALIKKLKINERVLDETVVKIEVLEKRSENGEKNMDSITLLKEELESSKKQEKIFSDALETLHLDLQAMEKENDILVKQMKKFERTSPSKSPRRNEYLDTMRTQSPIRQSSNLSTTNFEYDENIDLQITSLKSALRFLRTENSRLKSAHLLQSSSILFHPADPLMKKAQSTAIRIVEPEYHQSLSALKSEMKSLSNEINIRFSSRKIVDITNAGGITAEEGDSKKRWVSTKNSPGFQLENDRAGMRVLIEKVESGVEKVKKIALEHDGLRWSGYAFDESRLDYGRKIDRRRDEDRVPLGRVVLPVVKGDGGGEGGFCNPLNGTRELVLRSFGEFQSLHSLFST